MVMEEPVDPTTLTTPTTTPMVMTMVTPTTLTTPPKSMRKVTLTSRTIVSQTMKVT